MNIVFLDIDGVLNNDDSFFFDRDNIDTRCIQYFLNTMKEISEKIEIKIVISSSWRRSDLKRFKEYALDVCGRSNKKYMRELFKYLHKDWATKRLKSKRGKDVKEWLSRHPEVEKYLCIDDDSDFFKYQPLLLTEKFTTQLADRFKAVILEDLKLKHMTKSAKGTKENPGKNVKAKSGLNRELLRLGFNNFKQRLIDKQKARSHFVVLVNPRFTSQICSNCGHKSKESRVSQSEFKCIKCGYEINADYNASINIRERGIKVLKGNTKLGKVA